MKTTNEFIESQHELAAEMFHGPINVDLKKLVTHLIKDIGEELICLADEERNKAVKKKEAIQNDPFHPARCQYLGQQDGIDTIKKHITNLTGVE